MCKLAEGLVPVQVSPQLLKGFSARLSMMHPSRAQNHNPNYLLPTAVHLCASLAGPHKRHSKACTQAVIEGEVFGQTLWSIS